MKSKWWLVYNDFSKFQEYFSIIEFIMDTLKKDCIDCFKVPISSLLQNFEKTVFSAPYIADYVLFYDKNWGIASKLQKLGLTIINNPDCALQCEDKIATYRLLSTSDLIPRTLLFSIKNAKKNIDEIEKFIGFPLFVKFSQSFHGSNVFYFEDSNSLCQFLDSYSDSEEIAFQEALNFLPHKEIKIVSSNNCILSCYERELLPTGKFKCNSYFLNNEEINISMSVCQTLGLDFAGIDIMYRDANSPLVCDVNTQPNVLNIFRITGINVIQKIILNL